LGITYAGTENVIGELYIIDERSTFEIDSDLQILQPNQITLDSDFNIVEIFRIDSNFNALSQQFFTIATDFKCLTKEAVPITSIDDITPINLTDFQVFIDSIELDNTDLILDSISITHSVAEQSRASFRLSRKHDKLNTTLEGNSSTITNQNAVEIKIKGQTEFNGYISRVKGIYENAEVVEIEALADEKINKFNNITLSLPGLNSRLSLYDVLMETPDIFNPVIDEDNEEDPKKYKGIRVDLGTQITQRQARYTVFDSTGSIADDINDGNFNPKQNWSYFWNPTVKKFGATQITVETSTPEATDTSIDFSQITLPVFRFPNITFPFTNIASGDTSAIYFKYIGTSLAPVSEDLWNLENANHRRQRIYDDVETELGSYEVGSAPFQDISVRNGIKRTKYRWENRADGLYSVKEEGYNFVEFAKEVADLEYEKLKNINDNILPDTSCSLNLTVDGYLYYNITLLTRINIDNTTQSNIYKNNNGFPVSVKSITINSFDRKVIIEADNLKSVKELEVINDQFPDEDDPEYNQSEIALLVAPKSDMKTRLQII
jgi:hypothetical protein